MRIQYLEVLLLCFFTNFIRLNYCYNDEERSNNIYRNVNNDSLSPVIFINGDGGCQLEGRWSKPKTVFTFCVSHQASWTTLWLSISELAVAIINCFVDNVRLVYDPKTHTTNNSPGVEIRVPGFGLPDTIEYLDPSWPHEEYFARIGNTLRGLGYVNNVTLRGAPFDFRKAPNELCDYFAELYKLIEGTYELNGKRKIILIAHSSGAPTMHYFLINQSDAWKKKYIQSLITIAGAWGGAVKSLKVFSKGDNLGFRILSAGTLKKLQISMPSLAFLMPSQELWNETENLVETNLRNFTISDLELYFKLLQNPVGYMMYQDTKGILYEKPPPGVEIHCLHGLQVDTTEKLIYKNMDTDFPDDPELVVGDGDGTVNKKSLEKCLRFARKQSQKVFHATYPNVDHLGILSHQPMLDYIANYLKKRQRINRKKARIHKRKLGRSMSSYYKTFTEPAGENLNLNV